VTSVDPSELRDTAGQLRYAELAQRLIAERADLFRVAPPRLGARMVQLPPAPDVRTRRRRAGQLTLPLRPRVLEGSPGVPR
jgi:hypothetical protein